MGSRASIDVTGVEVPFAHHATGEIVRTRFEALGPHIQRVLGDEVREFLRRGGDAGITALAKLRTAHHP